VAAIYQSARPVTFAEVLGQDHVKDVLLAALRRGRASHAYLFSGPRGVGKTTTARLLAMALNCEAEDGGERPCSRCEGCRMVREGRHPDVIELDAASNNSVDDVRELREKTSLAAMRGGSRVWILDEAHMLSRPAANALLKTLEEPPPGLVFVLATTEPEKLPPTVLSRCQHFRFRRLAEAEILSKLERLCREAEVEAEPEALALVARAADGAMRDAESLLERLLTPGSTITLGAAEDALGLPPAHRMQRLAASLAAGDLTTLLSEAEGLYRDGFAPRSLAENLALVLRDALRAEVLGGAEDGFRLPLGQPELLRLIHALDDEQDRFVRRDDLYSLEVALIKGLNAVSGSPAETEVPAPSAARSVQSGPLAGPALATPTGVERSTMQGSTIQGSTMQGSTMQGSTVDGSTKQAPPRSTEKPAPQASATAVGEGTEDLPSFDPTGRLPQAAPRSGKAGGAASTGASSGGSPAGGAPKRLDWHAVRSKAGPQLKAFLMPARESVDGTEVTIRYGDSHRFHFNELKKREAELARLIEEIGGPGYRLRIEGPEDRTAKKS
jgi:DNA polymerase-3 subunit gamma/tau